MKVRLRAIIAFLAAALLTWAAPLAGLAASGQAIHEFLHFPPRAEYVAHASFAWDAFIGFAIPVLGAIMIYLVAVAGGRVDSTAAPARRTFPWWGWMGLAFVAAGWMLAWTEGAVPPEWRRHTFTPLWLGYVLVVNGLVYIRTGASPLTHRTGWFLTLFPVSAAFWWLFEHLNQFVDNWYYTGVVATGDWDYFLQATLPFSTVLPAVASTGSWLATFPRLDRMALPAMRGHPALAWVALLGGAIALAGIGIRPAILFPALWLGPLLVFVALQQLLTGETLLAPIANGDWRPLLQSALAGLVCGFFWELWNYGSAAKWHYSIPYVQRFQLFEMPLLGYAGYLPFGVECALVMDFVAKLSKKGTHTIF